MSLQRVVTRNLLAIAFLCWGVSVAPFAGAAPANLSAHTVSSTEIQITWTESSSGHTGYKIERAYSNGGPWSQIAIVGASARSYLDTGLAPSTYYAYRIRSYTETSHSAYSNLSGDTTRAGTPVDPVPNPPSGLSATAISSGEIGMSWTDNSGNETSFKIERARSFGGPWSEIKVVAANTTQFVDTGLTPSTFYVYRVRAYNPSGDSAYSNISADTTRTGPTVTIPSAPSFLIATPVSTDQVIVTWNDNSDDETSFHLERAGSSSGPWLPIANLQADTITHRDSGLAASTTYFYRVRARNAAGDSGFSNVGSATTGAPATVRPSAPSGLSANAKSSSQIDVSWRDNSDNESGFRVERGPGFGGPWTIVATLAAGSQSFQNTGLGGSTFYVYRVQAFNAAGPSSYSNLSGDTTRAGTNPPSPPAETVPAAPSQLTATAISASQIRLEWTDNSDNEATMLVERASYSSGPWFTLTSLPADTESYIDGGLTASTLFYYRIRASNATGASNPGNVAGTSTLSGGGGLIAPGNLRATAISSSQINLSWTDYATTETGFKIERASSAGGPWTQIATTSANVTSYANTGLGASSTFYYRVRAYDASSHTAYSAVASATTLSTGSISLSIPTSHPRLWWNADRLARARQWYSANRFTPSASDHMGNAFCYMMTGNTTQARTAINWLMNVTVSEAQLDPGNDYSSSDHARWYGEEAALVFDWCHDQMTASERQTIIERWSRYVDILRQKRWGGIGMEANNYYWGYLRNELEWGIATYHENPMAPVFIEHALKTRWQESFLPYAAVNGKGGVLGEGPSYGAVMPWYPLIPFVSLMDYGRNPWSETDFYKGVVFYTIYSTTPDRTQVVGTSDRVHQLFHANDEAYLESVYFFHSRNYYGDFMSQAANLWSGLSIGQYARRWLNMVEPSRSVHVTAVDAGGSERDFGSLPLDYHAPGAGYLYTRNRWGAQATSVNLQMGESFNVGHQHFDQGTWQIWRNARWLSRESTGYSRDIAGYAGQGTIDTSHTAAHNGILLGGRGIPVGHRDGTPQVVRLESRSTHSYAAVDLSDTYQTRNSGYPPDLLGNEFCSRVVREFVFIKPLETLVVFDRLESRSFGSISAASVAKTFVAHFEQAPQLQGAGNVLGINGDQALRLTTLVPSSPSYRVINEGTANVGQYRLEVETYGQAQSYFLHVLQARDANGANLTSQVTEGGSTFTVTLQHPTLGGARIIFNKGMTSTGGGFGFSSSGVPSSTTPFNSGVQSIQVTDSGPVWQ